MNTKKLLGYTLLVTLACGCSKSPRTTMEGGAGDQPQDSLVARIDQHGDEIMASSKKAEARQWMKEPKHIFFKADAKEVAHFVDDFYQAGAVQVFIADVEEEGGNQYGESLLVLLPKDPTARARLFEVETRADTAFQDDPVSDKGQKYLYNGLD